MLYLVYLLRKSTTAVFKQKDLIKEFVNNCLGRHDEMSETIIYL